MEYTRYTRLQPRTGLQTANLTAQLNLNLDVNCSGVNKVLHIHRTETTLFEGYNVYENSATGEQR